MSWGHAHGHTAEHRAIVAAQKAATAARAFLRAPSEHNRLMLIETLDHLDLMVGDLTHKELPA